MNPGLLAYGSGYILASRIDAIDPMHVDVPLEGNVWRYWGHARTRLEETDESFQPTGRTLEFGDSQDPRLFRAGTSMYVAFCRAWRQWVMPVVADHHFERFGNALVPNYERNQYMIGPGEKNWTWIDGTKDSLDCVYRWEPFTALRLDENGCVIERHHNGKVILPWVYGKINGGTPSVLLPSGLRFSVFHSHLGDPRVYYAGGVFHKPDWPYDPVRLLRKPLLVATDPAYVQFVRWPKMVTGQRCKTVFPCGLVAKPDRVVVSYGVNDCACAVAEFTYEELNDYDTGA